MENVIFERSVKSSDGLQILIAGSSYKVRIPQEKLVPIDHMALNISIYFENSVNGEKIFCNIPKGSMFESMVNGKWILIEKLSIPSLVNGSQGGLYTVTVEVPCLREDKMYPPNKTKESFHQWMENLEKLSTTEKITQDVFISKKTLQ